MENNSESTTVSTENSAETETQNTTESTKVNGTQTAHDDFDWSVDKRNRTHYEENASSEMEKVYEGTFKTLNDNEIILATVVGLTDTDVILNVGYKSDGLVSKTEFRDIEDLKVGMEVEVYVVSKEDVKGQLNLSRKSAKMMKAWEQIVTA